jgi:Ni/Co efflux regulator RcnB
MAKIKTSITTRLIIIAIAILTAVPAIADKPSWAGGGKQEKHKKNEPQGKHEKHKQNERQGNYDNKSHHDRDKPDYSGGRYFMDQHRTVIRDYYDHEYQTGLCPPGLAKKHNGCMPPGQAKKWVIGRPLPRDVVFYDLPPAVMRSIGSPPAGYRFVRAASDILMISTGTGMVIDAITDLGRN